MGQGAQPGRAARGDRAKRLFDAVFAAAGLVALAPVMAAVALVVGLSLGPPVIFTQLRPGLGTRPFRLHKFRTMRAGPGSDAERLTRLGRFLRRTSLDELPELWNVLRGDMSLVGPRPLLMEYLGLYSPAHARRHEVRPGLTGLAQVSGRNRLSWPERLDMDVWYVDHRSAAVDARILLRTLRAVMRRHEATQAGHATMEPFRGYGV